MYLRGISFCITLTALLLTSCATNRILPAMALDFFVPATSEDPWSRKIENWQARHQLDTALTSTSGRPTRSSDLGAAYGDFTETIRRRIANDTVEWVQQNSRQHYRPDGATDHWATLGEVVGSGGDDCDGLDLLTFVLLRRMGFGADEIYRAIVVEDGTGQHHMVTLWFESGRGDDPFVLDPTGVVAPRMVRLSTIGHWNPIELFDERRHFVVKPRTTPGQALIASD